jgi:hypothetical protein
MMLARDRSLSCVGVSPRNTGPECYSPGEPRLESALTEAIA